MAGDENSGLDPACGKLQTHAPMKMIEAPILEHAVVSGAYRRLLLGVGPMAPSVKPGQFVHIRVPRFGEAVLRRPFSVYRAEGETLEILYKTIGKGTLALADARAGDSVSVLGPLGNGFPEPPREALPVLVAGGYGVAPLYLLASRTARKGLLFVGGAASADILCVADFTRLGWDVRVATEDGSMGERGRVTDSLDRWLHGVDQAPRPEFYACGPDGMLRAVGERVIAGNWRGWLSLDKRMGCGVGACLACVQKIRGPEGGVQWKRVCKDGPVFEAREIVWE